MASPGSPLVPLAPAGLLALALGACASPPPPPADLVLTNARVYTADPSRERAEAVAIREGTIVRVGGASEVADVTGPDTTVVDLAGRFVMPGFNDAHIHFLDGALLLDKVRLDEARTLDEMLASVERYAAEHPDEPWIRGMGWVYTYVDGGRLPTRQDLDRVVSDRPVYLEAYDGHTAWTNTKALEVAGVTAASQPDGYGEIVKDTDGQPTGVFKETGAMSLIQRVLPRASRDEMLDALRLGLAQAARAGVTSFQNAHGALTAEDADGPLFDALDLYEELERRGELTARVYQAVTIDKRTTPERLDAVVAAKQRLTGSWVKAGAVKIVMDGVIESHTAGMLAPYSDDPSTSGAPDYSQEEIDGLVAEADRRGLQIFTHAIGDRSVRMVLDAYEKLGPATPGRERRHRIEHIEVIDAADVGRFASLGVIASMQPFHASPSIVGVWSRSVGEARQQRAFAWKTLRHAGALLVHGSDWPVVTISPLVGLHAAVTRESADGQPPGGWIPDERLSLGEAIAGYTIDGAFSSFDEAAKGSLAPGKLADLVVLSRDPFTIPPRELLTTEVVLTMVGGRAVYAVPGLLPEGVNGAQTMRRPVAFDVRTGRN